jgi:hypothetical protein
MLYMVPSRFSCLSWITAWGSFPVPGFHGPEAKRVHAASGHDLDGKAPLEILFVLEGPGGDFAALEYGLPELSILLLIERAIQIISLPLVVPGSPEDFCAVDRTGVDDGCDGIVEVQIVLADEAGDRTGKGIRCERSRGDDHVGIRGDFHALPPDDAQSLLSQENLLDVFGEKGTIHGQCLARRHGRGIGRRQDEGIEPAHFLLEKAHGARCLIGSEGIAADELGKVRRLVGGRSFSRFHLPELDLVAELRELPGSLAARKTAADNDYGFYIVHMKRRRVRG